MEGRSPLELQLRGYRLATAEIMYWLPDHPSILQTFVWQHYDLAPKFPELQKFLAFWNTHIEGKLFIDHISPLKRKLMKGKLNDISKGKINVDYKMMFPG